MEYSTIQLGTVANDGNGDTPRVAGSKINNNFATVFGSLRERVSTNRTYYVSTTGSDGNTGLSVGVPFETIQHAIAIIANTLSIDAGVTVTIQLADGTYDADTGIDLCDFVGCGSVVLQGNAGTPGNVVITSTAVLGSLAGLLNKTTANGYWLVRDLELVKGTESGNAIFVDNKGQLEIDNLIFGALNSGNHIRVKNGVVRVLGDYEIDGGAETHYNISVGGYLECLAHTITVTGTPAFSTAFVVGSKLAVLDVFNASYSGAATGVRYLFNTNSVCSTGSSGAGSFFPGSLAGSAVTGSIYD